VSPNEIVALIVGSLTILSIILGAIAWFVKIIVRDEVAKATRPIQPGYRNGGESLADVADTVRRIAKHVGLED
jgi:hypothetical protein